MSAQLNISEVPMTFQFDRVRCDGLRECFVGYTTNSFSYRWEA